MQRFGCRLRLWGLVSRWCHSSLLANGPPPLQGLNRTRAECMRQSMVSCPRADLRSGCSDSTWCWSRVCVIYTHLTLIVPDTMGKHIQGEPTQAEAALPKLHHKTHRAILCDLGAKNVIIDSSQLRKRSRMTNKSKNTHSDAPGMGICVAPILEEPKVGRKIILPHPKMPWQMFSSYITVQPPRSCN